MNGRFSIRRGRYHDPTEGHGSLHWQTEQWPNREQDLAVRKGIKAFLAGGPPTDRFALLFLQLIALVVVTPFVSSSGLARLFSYILAVASVLTTLRAVGAGASLVRVVVLGAVGLGAAMSWASTSVVSPVRAVSTVLVAFVMLIGPPLLVRRVFLRRKFGLPDVTAALCAYLQLGLFFAYLYTAVDLFGGDPFFAQGPSQAASDYLYFSFVTMLTLGYGDLTPGGDIGRALIIVETLVGQIFLVVLIAYLVGSMVAGGGPAVAANVEPDPPEEPPPRGGTA
jgi:hypothetical protein